MHPLATTGCELSPLLHAEPAPPALLTGHHPMEAWQQVDLGLGPTAEGQVVLLPSHHHACQQAVGWARPGAPHKLLALHTTTHHTTSQHITTLHNTPAGHTNKVCTRGSTQEGGSHLACMGLGVWGFWFWVGVWGSGVSRWACMMVWGLGFGGLGFWGLGSRGSVCGVLGFPSWGWLLWFVAGLGLGLGSPHTHTHTNTITAWQGLWWAGGPAPWAAQACMPQAWQLAPSAEVPLAMHACPWQVQACRIPPKSVVACMHACMHKAWPQQGKACLHVYIYATHTQPQLYFTSLGPPSPCPGEGLLPVELVPAPLQVPWVDTLLGQPAWPA